MPADKLVFAAQIFFFFFRSAESGPPFFILQFSFFIRNHPQRITTIIQTNPIGSMIQSDRFVNPSQAKKRYAFPNNPINSLSPGVVGIGRKPRRSIDGETVCHMVMATRIRKIVLKNIAVGSVHSIHVNVRLMVTPKINEN